MELHTYQHILKLGDADTAGILNSVVYITTKIDGSNGSIICDENGVIHTLSRKRECTIDSDNHGFAAYVASQDKYKKFFEKYPYLQLYGEWLKPHTIKYYVDSAWNKFYVFDVVNFENPDNVYYTTPEYYIPKLEEFGIEYIPIEAKLDHPSLDEVTTYLDKARFLLPDNPNLTSEGIVLKAYNEDGTPWLNAYNRHQNAKIVASEFRARHNHTPKNKATDNDVYSKILEGFVTDAFLEKEILKLYDQIGYENKYIARYLGTIWHTLIDEEMYNIVKKLHNPVIDFGLLYVMVTDKTKEAMKKVLVYESIPF